MLSLYFYVIYLSKTTISNLFFFLKEGKDFQTDI